ncbi:MAG TPA: hypothetical protein VMS37_33870 [Verrucomicrobiae bacterium]|nr:hypothetical protein [Verrucomicrobiae bacterium]
MRGLHFYPYPIIEAKPSRAPESAIESLPGSFLLDRLKRGETVYHRRNLQCCWESLWH